MTSGQSSSKELLEVIRKLDGEAITDNYNCTAAGNIANLVDPANHLLARSWEEVRQFFRKVEITLEKNLRVVRTELEIYSESSINIEDKLISTVQEVQDTANELLKQLNILKR